MNTQLSPYSPGQPYIVSTSGNTSGSALTTAPEGIPLEQALRATVSRNSEGEIGVRINDTFLKVQLPEGVKEGDSLHVILKKSKGSLILHILSPQLPSQATAIPHDTSKVKDAFQNILKALLPELSLDSIKKSYQSKTSLIHLIQNFQQQSGAKSESSTRAIQQLFESLYESKSLIPQQALKDPEKLVGILKNLIKAQGGEPKPSSSTEATPIQQKNSQLVQQVLKTLENEIQKVVNDQSIDLSLQEGTQVATKLAPLLSELSTSIQSSVVQNQSQFPQEYSFIGKLFETFLNLKKFVDTKGESFSPAIQKQLEQLLLQFPSLETAVKSGSEDEIRKALLSLLRTLEGNQREQRPSPQTGENAKSETNTQPLNKFFESIMQSRDQLARLQPLMQTLGDPLFFLMPVILNGMFQNWEMRFDPPKNIDSDESGGKGKKNDFTRIHLAIELPSLGGIQIDLAHRKEELLLSLKFEQEDVTDFVDSALPKLERTLRAQGYKHLSLVTRTGTPESVKPEWFKEVLDNSTVA